MFIGFEWFMSAVAGVCLFSGCVLLLALGLWVGGRLGLLLAAAVIVVIVLVLLIVLCISL